jgi:hypothetical protein
MLWIGFVIGFAVAALFAWYLSDQRAAVRLWKTLAAGPNAGTPLFSDSMLVGLPEAAQRYFRFSIQPGTPLHTIAEISMSGELGLGNQSSPRYQRMRAQQILAPPQGLVWRLSCGAPWLRIVGSDAALGALSWTRFWLFGVIPLVRVGASADHARSAYGRVIAESVFWVPAALLPGPGVSWHGIDDNTACATVVAGEFSQQVQLTVDEQGQPTRVTLQRWSNANAGRSYRQQPFGGYPSGYRDFEGYRLPTHVEGGNMIGTEEYFPFYIADVNSLRFLRSGPST